MSCHQAKTATRFGARVSAMTHAGVSISRRPNVGRETRPTRVTPPSCHRDHAARDAARAGRTTRRQLGARSIKHDGDIVLVPPPRTVARAVLAPPAVELFLWQIESANPGADRRSMFRQRPRPG